MPYLRILVLALFTLLTGDSAKIKIKDSNDIIDNNHIDVYLPSYPIVVAGANNAIGFFDKEQKEILYGMVITFRFSFDPIIN